MRKVTAWILMVFFTILTISDIALTWYNTPDLRQEANPLIAHFGLGWPALIIANLIVLALYCFLVYYALVIYPDKKREARAGAGKPGSYTLGVIGAAFSLSMPLARLVPVLEWVSVTRNKPMGGLLKLIFKIPVRRPDILLAGILALVFAVIWCLLERKEDKKFHTAMKGL